LTDSISVWALVVGASWVVQLVMLLLVLASLVSWTMIFQRMILLKNTHQELEHFEGRFWSGMDLGQLFREVNTEPHTNSGLENLFRAGFREFSRLRQQTDADPDAIMEGAQRAMRVVMSREEERLDAHLPFLATVGSISPYVGLFGTVIGIMNSFRGLANMNQATLATVAPGIAEALIATAMGLLAAIPAVVAYNRFSSRVEGLLNRYEMFTEEFSSILHRKVHSRRREG
jgi:biopolymer transport protein TolQ